ncbi:uncharacterized protein VNE69_11166 [Vairimorpha necatrix]|uniref:Uncharacterized protein n=1 Tax=Vairimorpha necatrix TaxID=6039 RepID=A0AAX4JGH8_9MICR
MKKSPYMLQYIFFKICLIATSSNNKTRSFTHIQKQNDGLKLKRKFNNNDESATCDKSSPRKKTKNFGSLSITSASNDNLQAQIFDKNNITTTLESDNFQNESNYKYLKLKLFSQLSTWKIEDEKKNLKNYSINDMEENDLKKYTTEKRKIRNRLFLFYASLGDHTNIIKKAVNTISYDDYSNDIKYQFDFFECIFYAIKRYTTSTHFLYKYDGLKIIDFYTTLPARLYIFEKAFQIVERFEIFIIFFKHQYLMDFSQNDKILLNNSLDEIFRYLKNLFKNLDAISLSCFNINEIFKKAVLK